MSPSSSILRSMVHLLLVSSPAMATPGPGPGPGPAPGPASPICGGNPCYPVLVGPVLNGIAKDYCSYFLKLSRTTTVTVKTTTTGTTAITQPAQTIPVTATAQATDTVTVTNTATVPGEVVTSTVTETATVQGMKKRDPLPFYTPPKGSGDGYKLPLLVPFAPAIISAACSCIVTPTTVTVTSTATATATATKTNTQPAVTTTIATVTQTVTSTITISATITAAPSTTTVITTTTTTLGPAQTCNGVPGTPQRAVQGILGPNANNVPPFSSNPSRITSAEQCYTACSRQQVPGRPETVPRAYSYDVANTAHPCACYSQQICKFFINDPAGPVMAGDTQLPF